MRCFRCLAVAALLAPSAGAITVANDNYPGAIDPGNPTFLGADQSAAVNLSGVVEIFIAGLGGCTGALLGDGSILTAGHCVDAGTPIAPSSITIYFPGVSTAYSATSIAVDPGFNGSNSTAGEDLAVIHLAQPAPSAATAYQLDLSPATFGVADVLDGYGVSGTGLTGDTGSFGALQAGENVFLETADEIDSAWSSNLLIGEFYESGVSSTNPLNCSPANRWGCRFSPFSAFDEVDISSGDSGGPAFQDVNGTFEIVGVNDLGICAGNGCTVNSSFGNLFGDTSVLGVGNQNLDFIEGQLAPEPGTLSLLAAALLAGLALRRRTA